MTANVKTVTDKGDKAALIQLEDGSKPIWTPDRELARTLLGKPIPSDWTVKEGEYGPQALPPRPKGGGPGVAWRNSKEGFEAEAAGRRRWQEIEEERKDRRTAAMTAFEHRLASATEAEVVVLAELIYDWLRETSGSVAGESPNPPVEKPALDPGPDTSPASLGEVGAGTSSEGKPGAQGPGVDSAIGTTPGPTKGYPFAPEKCDHRARGGYWLKTQVVDGQARCPRCGLSAVMYRES